MEDFSQLIKQLGDINRSIGELDRLFSDEQDIAFRNDQTRALDNIKSRLENEVYQLQCQNNRYEEIARGATLLSSALSLTIGTAMGAFMKAKNPLALGLKQLLAELNRPVDSGKVLIEIKGNAQLLKIKAVSTSRSTGDNENPKLRITLCNPEEDYFLLEPEKFCKILDFVREGVASEKYKTEIDQNKGILDTIKNGKY